MSTPSPTASRMASIPIAEVARIEPRSCFLDPACSNDLCFMFAPSLFRIIGSRKESCELPGPDRIRIGIHHYCFSDWQGRITIAHATDGAGAVTLCSSVGRRFGLG